ncbi:thioredoxin family protein [Pedobacter montanisoli]|uniref:Thioredoxin family protein n=1 Tax=Pedobacter montanisoli TaxID=2923277 RepID=A0ABS9ZRH2_9SPHI|nr:thioredoxin family protein [Pedobacter montanisoli]MCJ0741108.1 thioredoxin family protein [Pedobacter montanisoli]
MNRIKFLISALLLFIGNASFAQENLKDVLEQAKKTNKLVFIDCYFTGCIPCEEMDRDVFPNPVVSKVIDKDFILLKVNIFKDKLGDTLKVQHILNGFPTFLVLNPEGRLILNTSGFKDPGDLINLLKTAKESALNHKYLDGYSANYKESDYPAFYVNFALTRKGLNAQALDDYANSVTDFKAKNALMPFLIARTANEKVADLVIKDYQTYANLYGTDVLQPVVDKALLTALDKSMKNDNSEQAFNNFLSQHKKYFPANSWKINLQTLGESYFLRQKKDTVGYLNFAIANPVLYTFHFSALYSSINGKKGFNPQVASLFCKWADAIITPESSLELIKTAVSANKKAGNMVGFKKFIQMAIEKSKKYQIPFKDLEDMLTTAK